MTTLSLSEPINLVALHARFSQMLPTIRKHADFAFKHVKCRQTRADKVCEVVALCWQWTCRLASRGRDASRFVSTLALRASQAVKAGRRVTRCESKQCPLSERCQHLGRANVYSLPQRSTLAGTVFEEALADNTRSEPSEQAAFRIDFGNWRSGYAHRERNILDDMAASEATFALAAKYGLSPAAISQRRRRFHQSWIRFSEGDNRAAKPIAASA